ncbi:MAG: hypothetical protein KatS3mg109_0969 [Pirellulaceae bacterium]|nr:MAG: hypothetical protein KatS3mg109_0969 [Pirellulaceae bacterium]
MEELGRIGVKGIALWAYNKVTVPKNAASRAIILTSGGYRSHTSRGYQQMASDRRAALAALLHENRRFPLDAYLFVAESLRYAQEVLGMGRVSPFQPGMGEPERHVTGQELCEAVRLYAMEQFGLLARLVLAHWGIRSTSDIGDVVYDLIAIGEMKKSDTDRREDFDDVFDFEEAFDRQYEIVVPQLR